MWGSFQIQRAFQKGRREWRTQSPRPEGRQSSHSASGNPAKAWIWPGKHADTGRSHQLAHRVVLASLSDQTPAQRGDLLVDGFPSSQQCFNNIVQRTVGDQAANLLSEGLADSLASEQAERLKSATTFMSRIHHDKRFALSNRKRRRGV